MTEKKRRVTIKDVARQAQVGVGTVSRVLAGSKQVSEATRSRVLSSIKELNFQPSRIAGALASRRTGLVAILVPTLSHSVFTETIDGLSEVLGAGDVQLMVGYTSYSADRERVLIETFLRHWPEALVLTGEVRSAQTRELLEAAEIPLVETWELPENPLDLAVGFDNRAAARAMTEALIERGYREIVMIARRTGTDRRNDLRKAGYELAMRRAGLAPRFAALPEDLVQYMTAGRVAFQSVLAEWPNADALFCSNDIHAAGALFECQRRGIQVPRDLAIAGFGDFPVAEEVHPNLTTVRVPGREIGREAGRLLLRRLAGEDVADPVRDLGYTVVNRESA